MKQQNEGFTLIEILVVLSIMGVVATAVTNLFVAGWNSSQYTQEQLSLKTEERFILNRLEDNIMRSREVEVRDGGSELVLKITTDDDAEPEECLKYAVENNILKIWQVATTNETKKIGEDKWPDNDPGSSWGSAVNVTQKIVVDTEYSYDSATNTLEIDIALTKDNDFTEVDYRVKEIFNLRLLD